MYTVKSGIDEDNFGVAKEDRRIIEHAANWSVQRFGKQNTSYVKHYQYTSHSPNEFVRTYSELRDRLERNDLSVQRTLSENQLDGSSNKALIIDLLDQMIVSFLYRRRRAVRCILIVG